LDRHLREITGAQGREVLIAGWFINFSSNDYLGLANDPRLREVAARLRIDVSPSTRKVEFKRYLN
jgi:7-keto-8-aminopelargonate synthetase-like enzyme